MEKSEVKFIVERIQKLSNSIQHEFFQHHMNMNHNGDYAEEFPGYTDTWISLRLVDVYYLILAFFEAKSLPDSYKTFRERFSSILENDDELLREEQYHPDSESELKVLHDFFVHLYPYPEFALQTKIDNELLKVHCILKNTGHILAKLNTEVEGEADIYNSVRWVLGLYFPKTRRKNKASFIKQFQTYQPDILIPDLKTAVEYKYIKTGEENKIDGYVDQVKVDSVNYTDDPRYDNFIAVIHLKSSEISTPEKIEESWASKEFPDNWKLIVTSP